MRNICITPEVQALLDAYDAMTQSRDFWKQKFEETEPAVRLLRSLVEQGCVANEGDFLLGDMWLEEEQPVQPAIITMVEEWFQSIGAPLEIQRNPA